MCNHLRLFSVLLISGVAGAQTTGAATAIHPSNGVVELSAKPVLAYERGPRSPEIYTPWAGLVRITIRNISGGAIRLDEMAVSAELQAEVLDSAGQPAPLTEEGKRAATNSRQYPGAISVSMDVLTPLEEMTVLLDVSKRFEIKPGQAYKVTIRRSRGFPRKDEDGKPIKNEEVSCSFEVPYYGILSNEVRYQ
jgi:hypothetical protein